MKTIVMAMLAAGALAALGCGDKTPEAKPATATPAADSAKPQSAPAAAAPAAAPAKPKGGW